MSAATFFRGFVRVGVANFRHLWHACSRRHSDNGRDDLGRTRSVHIEQAMLGREFSLSRIISVKYRISSRAPRRHRFIRPVWARERCRISPPRFLAECCKRQLNQGSVFCCILGCLLFLICIEFVFSCTVLFVSISQAIGCEDRLRNDLYCVGWGVKLYSNSNSKALFAQMSLRANSNAILVDQQANINISPLTMS